MILKSTEERSRSKENLPETAALVESVLFASGEALDKGHISSGLEISESELDGAVAYLKKKYEKADSGLTIVETDSTLKLYSKEKNHAVIRKILALDKRKGLTRAGAEVLAIIAYNGPVTRIEIDQIRGVSSAGALQRLIDQGLVREAGRKEVVGLPFLYETTPLFLDLAGVKSLEELPSFDSFAKAFS